MISSSDFILGFDIGGTKISGIIADNHGKILKSSRKYTVKHMGKEKIIEDLDFMGNSMIDESGIYPDTISIIFAGLVDSEQGKIISSPNLFGLSDFNIVKDLKKVFHSKVILENDATAAAISEKVFGKGKNMDDFIYISLSTGIGGGIFVNGNLLRGNNGLAGEIGHTVILPDGPFCGCGRRGCIEALAGGKAIARRIMENRTMLKESAFFSEIPSGKITAKHMFDAVKKGDMYAQLILEETIFYLSTAISNLICSFDPEAIIIGGSISMAGNMLFKPLKQSIDESLKGMYRDVKLIRSDPETGKIAPIAVSVYKP